MSTIRQRLTRRLLLAASLLLGLGGVAAYWCVRAALQAQFDETLRAKAQTLISMTEQKSGHIETEFAEKKITGFQSVDGPDFFELRHANGALITNSASLHGASLAPHFPPLGTVLIENLALPNRKTGRALGIRFKPLVSDEDPAPATLEEAVLVVASDRGEMDRTLGILKLVLAGCGALLLVATGWLVPSVLRRELLPLQRLGEQAAQIDQSSLSARFPTEGLPGELAPISARLNELLARLESAFERERRFSADVAHEFRTPIAELRAMAELAIKLPHTRSTATDREVLAIALHLESVITRLLALARGELGRLEPAFAPVFLSKLVADVVEHHRAKALERRLAFDVQVDPNLAIRTDPELLRSILDNLINNAVEYSPAEGRVQVAGTAASGRWSVQVTNPTRDLEPDDLPRLFERFWRKDSARTADGHIGLGLSLSRTLAGALGCKLDASVVAPGRLCMTLEKVPAPACSQPPPG